MLKNDAQVRATKSPETGRVDHSVYGVPGLRLRVTMAGTKTFRMESRKTGKVTIGNFPAISLKEARSAAQALLSDTDRAKVNRRAGVPVLAKVTRRTLLQVLDAFQSDRARSMAGWEAERRAIEYRYGDWLKLPAADLTKDLVLHPVRRGRTVAAKRSATYLSKVLRWAEIGEPVSAKVLNDLVPEKAKDRVLSHDEMRLIWKSSEAIYSTVWADFTKALFLTMQRRGDVAMMRRDECFDGNWKAMIHKNRGGAVSLMLPLSGSMSAIIAKGNGEWVFPAKTGNPLSHGFDKQQKRLWKASGTSNWTWHDIRRTSRTLMSAARVPPHIAERCMAHSTGKMVSVYDQHDWLPEMRNAFDALENSVMEIVNG